MSNDTLSIRSTVPAPKVQELRSANDASVVDGPKDKLRLNESVADETAAFEADLNKRSIMTKSADKGGGALSAAAEFEQKSPYGGF